MVKNDRDGRTFAAALVKTLPRCGPVTPTTRQSLANKYLIQKGEICRCSRHLALGIEIVSGNVFQIEEIILGSLPEMKSAPIQLLACTGKLCLGRTFSWWVGCFVLYRFEN